MLESLLRRRPSHATVVAYLALIDEIFPSSEDIVPGRVLVRAFEEEATNVNWAVEAIALCANVS